VGQPGFKLVSVSYSVNSFPLSKFICPDFEKDTTFTTEFPITILIKPSHRTTKEERSVCLHGHF
jgi:hypothetical protein